MEVDHDRRCDTDRRIRTDDDSDQQRKRESTDDFATEDEDGQEYEERIRTWQMREAKHFKEERTREFADFIISTT